MSFTILKKEKTPFLAIKTRKLKIRKIDIFPKGLTHGFGPKMANFGTFSISQLWAGKWPFLELSLLASLGQENVLYDILERKNAFLGYKNKMLKKSKNWDFSKGVNPCFWSKNGHFSNFFY